jgi:hypothetical protein
MSCRREKKVSSMKASRKNLMKKLHLKFCRYFSHVSLTTGKLQNENKKAMPPESKVETKTLTEYSTFPKKVLEFIWRRELC